MIMTTTTTLATLTEMFTKVFATGDDALFDKVFSALVRDGIDSKILAQAVSEGYKAANAR